MGYRKVTTGYQRPTVGFRTRPAASASSGGGASAPARVHRGLGANVDYLVSYGGDFPSKNLMWQCTTFGVTNVSLNVFESGCPLSSIALDADGYPTHAPQTVSGYAEGQVVFTTCVGGSIPSPYFYPAGEYRIYYDGAPVSGTAIRVRGDSGNINITASGQAFTITTPTSGGLGVVILSSTLGNNIRNIRVIVPGETDATYAANPWSTGATGYLSIIQNMGMLRFMNWQGMNRNMTDNPVTDWASRRRQGYYTQTTSKMGMAPEWIVDLTNRVQCDPWVNIYHSCTDDYTTGFAAIAFNGSPTDRIWRFEANNESWNGVFAVQHTYLINLGISLGFNLVGPGTLGTDTTNASIRYACAMKAHAYQQARVHRCVADVFGANSLRVKRGIGAFVANYATTRLILDAYHHAAINPYMTAGLPTYPLDEVYVAPYWADTVSETVRATPTTATATLVATAVSEAYSQPTTWFAGLQPHATRYNVKIVCYEHGFAAAIAGAPAPTAEMVAKMLEVRRDAGFQAAQTEFFRACDNSGVSPVGCILGLVWPPQTSGCWGALESQLQTRNTPTWLSVLARLNAEVPV